MSRSYRSSQDGEKSMVFHYIYRIVTLILSVINGFGLLGIFGIISLVYYQLTSVGVDLDPVAILVTVCSALMSLISYFLLLTITIGLWFKKRWLPSVIHGRTVLLIWFNAIVWGLSVLSLYLSEAFNTNGLVVLFSLLVSGIKVFLLCAAYWLIDVYYQERTFYFCK